MNTQLVVSFTALAVFYYLIQPLGAIFQSESNLRQQQKSRTWTKVLRINLA
jgi:hypothetical protein